MKFIDFFAGVGGFRRGMELAGHECVGFCEFDKMNNLPSDSREEKEYIRLSTDTFEDVIAGRRPYLILKNDKIRTGMIVSALEFMQGRATGRELTLEIVCMDDAGTSSALEDGYCVVGIRQQEILKEAGADAAEYADQPAMQYGA